MTENEMLVILMNDDWFQPTNREKWKTITLDDGTTMDVSESYYKQIDNVGTISIRVSNHCTYLQTWLNARQDVRNAVQNLSVVLMNGSCTYNTNTLPRRINLSDQMIYMYFVVEQYQYQLSKLSKKDFMKILKSIKKLEDFGVYKDPLKKKSDKRALRKVLTPTDINGNPISPNNNTIHPRQTVVANNKDKEVDFDGNVLEQKKSLYNSVMNEVAIIIKKKIDELLD